MWTDPSQGGFLLQCTLDVLHCVTTLNLPSDFHFEEEDKLAWSQIWQAAQVLNEYCIVQPKKNCPGTMVHTTAECFLLLVSLSKRVELYSNSLTLEDKC